MIYTVFSTTDTANMNWQALLLEYSWKEVNQPGELIRLVATGDRSHLPTALHAKIVPTWPWDIHPLTGDRYVIYNKPASLSQWLTTEKPEGTVLFIDPDCVFRAPITQEVKEGRPVSQKWISFNPLANYPLTGRPTHEILQPFCKNNADLMQGIMIPTLIHTNDLKRILPRWLEVTGQIRQGVKDQQGRPLWESDMFGYIIAAAELGLVHEQADLGFCTHWSPQDVVDAPIIHYCHPVRSTNQEVMWSKNTYQPWGTVVEPSRAQHQEGQTLLDILNSFIACRSFKSDEMGTLC